MRWTAAWPFPRAEHGKLIDKLKAAGAKVVVMDVQFTEPSQEGPDDDYALADSTASAGNVVFATTETDEKTGATKVMGGDDNVKAAAWKLSADEMAEIDRITKGT